MSLTASSSAALSLTKGRRAGTGNEGRLLLTQ